MSGGESLRDRVVIVTGAGQGVGEGIARRLAAEGARVVVAARRAETGEPVATSIRNDGGDATCIETDVGVAESVRDCVAETVRRFGRLDIVVHNAFTGGIPHRLENARIEKHWTAMSRTSVWASLFCARESYRYLLESSSRPSGEGGGRLILITSPSGVEGSANIPLIRRPRPANGPSPRAWPVNGVRVGSP